MNSSTERPNPSVNLTHYSLFCKAGREGLWHFSRPALQNRFNGSDFEHHDIVPRMGLMEK